MRIVNKFFSKRALLFVAAALLMLASCTPKEQSKYKYETVKGDLTEARIYTLDNWQLHFVQSYFGS